MGKIRRLLHLIGHRMTGLPTCQDVNGFLADYLEGGLDEKTRARFERHMRRCPPCERYFDQYRETITLVRTEGAQEVPADLVEHTLEFLRRNGAAT